MSAIFDFASLFELRDFVDILLIAFLLYTVIIWARRLRVSRIVSGLGTLALIYVVASLFELQLTVWVFQGLFAVMAIVLVVIFQDELRQLFERLAAWEFTEPNRAPADWQATEPLVAALTKLASQKIGALVVIPGRDSVEHELAGGIPIDAMISSPLIESLFDAHSPGHDGAAVLNGDRVSRFAVHLPLSTDFTQLQDRGTRHAAALGLAERTDALCIVVSEERGRISVGQGGRINEVEGAGELTARIQSFLKENAVAQPLERGRRILTLRRQWPEKAASLLLAMVAWVAFVPDFGIEERSVTARVVVENLPVNRSVSVIDPEQVSVALRGTGESFDRQDLGLVTVTLNALPEGVGITMMRINPGDVSAPEGLEFVRADPELVRLEITESSSGP